MKETAKQTGKVREAERERGGDKIEREREIEERIPLSLLSPSQSLFLHPISFFPPLSSFLLSFHTLSLSFPPSLSLSLSLSVPYFFHSSSLSLSFYSLSHSFSSNLSPSLPLPYFLSLSVSLPLRRPSLPRAPQKLENFSLILFSIFFDDKDSVL